MKNTSCFGIGRFAELAIPCILLLGQSTTSITSAGEIAFGTATKLGPMVNSQSGEYEATYSTDGLEIFFASNRSNPGVVSMNYFDIYVTKRAHPDAPWSPAVSLGPAVNSSRADEHPFLTSDGLTLYFDSYRSETWYGDLWMTTRASKDDDWGPPVNLGFPVNSQGYGYTDEDPSLTSDGLELYFTSDRDGPHWRYNLWVTKRESIHAPWGQPVNLGPTVNGDYSNSSLAISPDGLVLIFSRGTTLWITRRASRTDNWCQPQKLGPTVNFMNINVNPYFSPDGRWLLWSSANGSVDTYDIWQAPILPIVDFNADGKVDEKDFLTMTQHWGQDYPLCDIGPMAWGDGVVDARDQIVLMETMEGRDFTLSPGLHASDVPRDVILTWTSPQFAKTHDVYFGTSFTDVNSASRNNPRGVLVGKGQAATMYDPEGLLPFGRTYYWRIDEVGGAPDFTIYRGPVLDFKTEAYPIIRSIIATASSVQPGMGPEKTIDGSGLTGDLHGTESTTMWMSTGVTPNWIQYQFDKVYKLHELWVWNTNQLVEGFLGWGAKKVTIEYSVDGTTWTLFNDVPEFARAPGAADYTPNTIVSFGGVSAKYVKLTIKTTWGGMSSVTGLSEVRFFYLPE